MTRILALAPLVGLAAAIDCGPLSAMTARQCPSVSWTDFKQSVPDLQPFPRTEVGLCHSEAYLEIRFIAHDEVNFFYDSTQRTNDDIWRYEVMEAFISAGTVDPQSYLEVEVSPNNVTYLAVIDNPSKERAPGTPFRHAFIEGPAREGFSAVTELNRTRKTWSSTLKIPLGLLNAEKGAVAGTAWRMNFFRTVVSPQTFPNQTLGAWVAPRQANFHVTKCFGQVYFMQSETPAS